MGPHARDGPLLCAAIADNRHVSRHGHGGKPHRDPRAVHARQTRRRRGNWAAAGTERCCVPPVSPGQAVSSGQAASPSASEPSLPVSRAVIVLALAGIDPAAARRICFHPGFAVTLASPHTCPIPHVRASKLAASKLAASKLAASKLPASELATSHRPNGRANADVNVIVQRRPHRA